MKDGVAYLKTMGLPENVGVPKVIPKGWVERVWDGLGNSGGVGVVFGWAKEGEGVGVWRGRAKFEAGEVAQLRTLFDRNAARGEGEEEEEEEEEQ